MHRRARHILMLAAALLVALAGSAHAHDLIVIGEGTQRIDVGTLERDRLIHGALLRADDQLVITVAPRTGALQIQLLVPNRRPENRADDADLPTLEIASAAERRTVTPEDPTIIEDEITGLTYLLVTSASMDTARTEGPTVITIGRGDTPTRVAVHVSDGGPFVTEQPQRTPRTLAQLRSWYENPAPGAKVDRSIPDSKGRPRTALYGGIIALLAVLIAVWWVWAGRRRSRERGAERANDDAESESVPE